MVYRSIQDHKTPLMNQNAHLPLVHCYHVVGQIRVLGGVPGPDKLGVTTIRPSVTRALQRHHLSCLDIFLCGSQGTHTCKYMAHILVHFTV